jgi:hypothetical protein
MWSSPLLLLVLVFTLNSRPLHPATAAPTTSTTATPTTSTTSGPGPTTTSPATTTSTTTTEPATESTTSTTPATTPATTTLNPPSGITTTTIGDRGATSSGSIEANGASSVVDSGHLSLSAPAALVPLSGPGRWSVAASHPVTLTVLCGSRSGTVNGSWQLAADQKCQLDITIATGAPTSWSLHRVH